MPTVKVTFSQSEGDEPRYRPVPEGEYLVKIIKAEPGLSQTEQPKISVRYHVEEPGFEKRLLFDDFSLLEQATWRLRKLMRALGHPPDKLKGMIEVDTERDLLGRLVVVRVVHEKRASGKGVREKCDDYISPDDAAAGGSDGLGAPLADEDEVPF